MKSGAPKATQEQLLAQALQLPKAERLHLADRIWESVEGEEAQEAIELSPELNTELLRRLKSVEDGSATLLDGEQTMHELRGKLGAR